MKNSWTWNSLYKFSTAWKVPIKSSLTISLITQLLGCSSYYSGPKSSNYDGSRFFHTWPQRDHSFFDLIKWKWTSEKAEWPDEVQNKITPQFPKEIKSEQMALTFINHASVYVQHAGMTFITDPQWSQRASPVSFAGPKRVRPAGAEIDQLPGLQYVFLSHNHYDHFDIPTLKKLKELYNPLFLIPLGDAYLMKDAGIEKFKEMNWWDEVDAGEGRKITFVPVKHWSARGLGDRNKSLWGGFVVTTPSQKIFFAGDTGYCDVFSTLSQEFGNFSLSILPIGAYEPRWFMKDSHMNPEESVQAHIDLKTKHSMAIHFGTWQLTDEAIDQPVKDLHTALEKRNLSKNVFQVFEVGETRVLE